MDDATERREIEEAGFDPDEVLVDDMDEDEFIVVFRHGPDWRDWIEEQPKKS
jgi:hypothetical protein